MAPGIIADATAAGELFEYWVHEASHVPTAHHHLHRWRMDAIHKWERYWTMTKRRPGYLDEVLQRFPTWDVDWDNAKQARTSTVRGWEALPVFTS